MIALLIGMAGLALSTIDVPLPDPVPGLTEVPELKDTNSCTCPAEVERADVTLSGFVVDAKVILGADRRSVEDRMATIFDVKQADDSKVSGRTAVWHDVSEEKCGVSFDYGKKYSVSARRNEEGELETDRCLMGW